MDFADALLGALAGRRASSTRRSEQQAAEEERRRQEAQQEAARIQQQQQQRDATIIRLALQDPVTALEAGVFEDPRVSEVLGQIGINPQRLAQRAEDLRGQGQQAQNLDTVRALLPLAQSGVDLAPLVGGGGGGEQIQAMPSREGVEVPGVGGAQQDPLLDVDPEVQEFLLDVQDSIESGEQESALEALQMAVARGFISPRAAAQMGQFDADSFEGLAPAEDPSAQRQGSIPATVISNLPMDEAEAVANNQEMDTATRLVAGARARGAFEDDDFDQAAFSIFRSMLDQRLSQAEMFEEPAPGPDEVQGLIEESKRLTGMFRASGETPQDGTEMFLQSSGLIGRFLRQGPEALSVQERMRLRELREMPGFQEFATQIANAIGNEPQ